MIKDASRQNSEDLHADVCICGAGPAGIVLALELAKRRPDWHIVLLEAGGRSVETETERALYHVDLGPKPYAVTASRRRMLGGTSAHWGGWCRPLHDTDFTTPSGWSIPDWPLGPDDLAPYMAAAHQWCEIKSDNYDMGAIRSRHPKRFLALPDNSGIDENVFRFSSPTRFGARYESDLEAQKNLTCVIRANVFGFEKRGDTLTSVSAKALNQPAFKVRANRVVLAQGGLETTRTLLNLRGDASDDGEGLRSPHLGRHFTDHYGLRPGLLIAPANLGYMRFGDQGIPIMPVLTPSAERLRSGQSQNLCVMLDPQADAESLPDNYAGQPALGFHSQEYWNYRAQLILEPRPEPDSRITLSGTRCALGLRHAHLNWVINPNDIQLALEFFDHLGSTLASTGQGRSRTTYEDTSALRARINGANHHMGTARFSKDPKDGVTDADGRVHDMSNLYVASSALFPRVGYANPTLTIVALAVRLASRWADEGKESTP